MKVTQVAIRPSEGSDRAGRPALTPELLAASGARYSRNNEGLESILSRIDPERLEKSVDSIFRMVDYGHQSIADMVPVTMFIDGISIWLAYYLWTLCPTAGGQECSTRYIKIAQEGLIPPDTLGIPTSDMPEWSELMDRCFRSYQAALAIWEQLAQDNPAVMGIPRSLLEDTSETAQKKVARMRRNYAFDRARYFLPVSAATNVMLLMSARGWVNLCQYLLSHPLPEPRQLGQMLRGELELAAPRMLKHARVTESNRRLLDSEFRKLVERANSVGDDVRSLRTGEPHRIGDSSRRLLQTESAKPFLKVTLPEGVSPEELAKDLETHSNRYAPIGSSLQRTAVQFGWSAIGFAEIRDLNRHRTGSKFCPQVPQGFYFALEQLPPRATEQRARLLKEAEIGFVASSRALALLRQASPSYIYWSVLGTEYPFEHTTTADKFIYEAELRTGLGAHYRYAKHLRDVLALWYEQFPTTKGLILEGSAEPE